MRARLAKLAVSCIFFCERLSSRVKCHSLVSVSRGRHTPIPAMQATTIPSLSTDAGSESTHDDLDTLCDMFCAPLPNALHHM